MGSSVGVLGRDRRRKAIVTQVKQENIRLQAKVERLSTEATQLRAEIGYLRKEKEKGNSQDKVSTICLDHAQVDMKGLYNNLCIHS